MNRRGACWRWGAIAVVAALPLGVFPLGAFAEDGRLARELDALLSRLPQPSAVCGAAVVDAASGVAVYEGGAGTALLPASNAKLLVMAAAVDQFGPDFAFRTVLGLQGDDLVVLGDGDPAIGDPKLCAARGEPADAVFSRWAAALAARGIAEIAGDLVIDESIFDQRLTHSTWDTADRLKWYAAPVGALNLNDNCVDVTLLPAAEAGDPVSVEAVPRARIVELVNRCTTATDGKGRPVINRPADDFRFVISGRCHKRWTFPPVPVVDPGLLFADALRTHLEARGIAIRGRIVRRRVRTAGGGQPESFTVVAEEATSLADVLQRVGKDSQNLFAECLMKRLGYEWARRHGMEAAVGSWETGAAAVRVTLRRAGVSESGVVIADASGLSRANRVTATALTAVLSYMYRHRHRALFVDALAVAGVDGSLARRMQGLAGSVRAKTGYMRGVRTLSGYVATPGGDWLCFAVLFNGFTGPTSPYNQLHDKVCRILARGSGPSS